MLSGSEGSVGHSLSLSINIRRFVKDHVDHVASHTDGTVKLAGSRVCQCCTERKEALPQVRLFLRVFFMVLAGIVKGFDQTPGGELICWCGYAEDVARSPRESGPDVDPSSDRWADIASASSSGDMDTIVEFRRSPTTPGFMPSAVPDSHSSAIGGASRPLEPERDVGLRRSCSVPCRAARGDEEAGVRWLLSCVGLRDPNPKLPCVDDRRRCWTSSCRSWRYLCVPGRVSRPMLLGVISIVDGENTLLRDENLASRFCKVTLDGSPFAVLAGAFARTFDFALTTRDAAGRMAMLEAPSSNKT